MIYILLTLLLGCNPIVSITYNREGNPSEVSYKNGAKNIMNNLRKSDGSNTKSVSVSSNANATQFSVYNNSETFSDIFINNSASSEAIMASFKTTIAGVKFISLSGNKISIINKAPEGINRIDLIDKKEDVDFSQFEFDNRKNKESLFIVESPTREETITSKIDENSYSIEISFRSSKEDFPHSIHFKLEIYRSNEKYNIVDISIYKQESGKDRRFMARNRLYYAKQVDERTVLTAINSNQGIPYPLRNAIKLGESKNSASNLDNSDILNEYDLAIDYGDTIDTLKDGKEEKGVVYHYFRDNAELSQSLKSIGADALLDSSQFRNLDKFLRFFSLIELLNLLLTN